MQKTLIYLILSTVFIAPATMADGNSSIIKKISTKCQGENASKTVCVKLAQYTTKTPSDGVTMSIMGELKRSFSSSIPICASNVDLSQPNTKYIELCLNEALKAK